MGVGRRVGEESGKRRALWSFICSTAFTQFDVFTTTPFCLYPEASARRLSRRVPRADWRGPASVCGLVDRVVDRLVDRLVELHASVQLAPGRRVPFLQPDPGPLLQIVLPRPQCGARARLTQDLDPTRSDPGTSPRSFVLRAGRMQFGEFSTSAFIGSKPILRV